MSKNLLRVWGLSMALGLLVLGCAKVPQEAVTSARSAVDSARVAEAPLYAPEQFRAASDSLEAAMTEIEKQNSKNMFTRKYDLAEQRLISARGLAESSVRMAAENKARVMAESAESITMLEAAIVEAKALIEKAPRGKDGAAVLEAMKGEIAAVEQALATATASRAAGDFFGARDTARAATETVKAISAELTTAIEKKKMGTR
jgi:hypothetical protein